MWRLPRSLALLVSVLSSWPGSVQAGLVVIAHPASGIDQLSREQVINIFLGRYRKLPGGQPALPLDCGCARREREQFYRLLVDKTPNEINAYWARLLFTGRVAAPPQIATSAEVIDQVAGNPAMLGYVWRDQVDRRVKVVLELELDP